MLVRQASAFGKFPTARIPIRLYLASHQPSDYRAASKSIIAAEPLVLCPVNEHAGSNLKVRVADNPTRIAASCGAIRKEASCAW